MSCKHPGSKSGAPIQERPRRGYIRFMCGRFTRKYTWQQIHALYRLTVPAAIPNFQPDYNVCPTDPADVVVPNEGACDLVRMRWGLVPYWWSKPLKKLRLATFNARVEMVTTKPFFREPFKKRRCLMPVSGYYEWEDTPSGKQPHYFTARDGSPVLTIAGLWDEWKNRETGERIKSCAMIITEPNDFIAEVHDRMPVLLRPDQFDHWLSGCMTVEELQPVPNDYLQRWAVSKRVNSSKADKDDPRLIEPVRLAA
jgi:putative SOS response-associated peptidase YedK